ncbi:MAG: hypothetical protein HC929_02145 [Leptolyngbyaceae cyanobacterium SM2_5_2]|nr:hypothetical protein [Leptolyngbyaceae cyanobacterium SM2_5_2]
MSAETPVSTTVAVPQAALTQLPTVVPVEPLTANAQVEPWLVEALHQLNQPAEATAQPTPAPAIADSGTPDVAIPAAEVASEDLAIEELTMTYSAEPLQWLEAEGWDGLVAPANADLPLAQAGSGDETASVWHFSFKPFMLIPVNIDANLRVRDIGVNVNAGLGDVLEALDFAFLGDFEGWYEHQGFVLRTEYFAVSTARTRNFNIPPVLQGILPSELTASASADLLSLDLLYAYRFSEPPEGGYGEGFTEFELPPVSFDLMGGCGFPGSPKTLLSALTWVERSANPLAK